MDVVGFCPMGCGQTLFLGDDGYVTCSYLECPNPTAVCEVLADGDTRHLIKVEETTFSVQHPLRERLDGKLFDCTVHQQIKALAGPPMPPGLYRVALSDDGRILGWESATRSDPPTQ